MADHDARAAQIVGCCGRLGLDVPGQIAVLGVDNDRVICDFTTLPLTSIQPDHEKVGYRAAAKLSPMMRRRRPDRKRIVRCSKMTVVARESTHPIAPSARLVREALTFIVLHACEGIRVTDVVKYLGVSRAFADLRFRKVAKKTILKTIVERKLKEVVRHLAATAEPIAQHSVICGFRNLKHLKRLFTSRCGVSMRKRRKIHANAVDR